MAREIRISIYLFFFGLLFHILKLLPLKKKTVCVASFGDNIFYTVRSLRSLSNEEIIILKAHRCNYPFDTSTGKVVNFNVTHPLAYIQSIYHLATATTILIDNYFGFLAVTEFKKGTNCVQLWHAAGAIKQFGFNDPSVQRRNKRAKERFQRVYNRFDYTVVGSEEMAAVFRESFRVSDDSLLRTGIPRTDLFYSAERQRIAKKLKADFPSIRDRKIILYAPTFRDQELNNYNLMLDIRQLYQELSAEYVLFIKLHPAVKNKINHNLNTEFHNFVYDVSDYYDANHLLLFTDLLITDYSSIPFEYALLQKPIIFFAYDLDTYQKKTGLLKDYVRKVPGPVVYTTEAIVQMIKEGHFNKNIIKAFAIEWNQYSTGSSSIRLAEFLTKTEEKKEIIM